MMNIIPLEDAEKTILRRAPQGANIAPQTRTRLRQLFGEEVTPQEAVRRILQDVRENGDAAVAHWTEAIDGARIPAPAIPRAEWEAACQRLPADLRESLQLAAERVRAFHARQPIPDWTTREMGGLLGQRVTPLRRVGAYVPGGSAPLPSSLLMTIIPAKVAGVEEAVVVTPPGRAEGRIPDVILAAAYLARADALYCVGGAQAIAALAFGTPLIPRVDKIVGAGNLFVTLAKQQVFGLVGLDGLAGPTETVVVADDSARADWVAADLLAQAEHDVLATAILLTPSRRLAEAVQAEVARQIEDRARSEIIAASLAGQSGIILTPTLEVAVRAADRFAPEHLCLAVQDPNRWARLVRSAGGLFLGEHSFEVLGDYIAGPSHVMPTGGTARFASPLNVLDFMRITSIIALDGAPAADLSAHADRIARAESLDGHAAAARFRVEASSSKDAAAVPPYRFEEASEGGDAYEAVVPFEIWAQRLGIPAKRIVKLDANENPYGPSPRTLRTLAAGRGFNIYPDPDSTILRERLAQFLDIPSACIFAGAGADEVIDSLLRAAAAPGDVVVDCPPTFGMYSFETGINRLRLLEVPRMADFRLNVEGIEAAVRAEPRAKVLFLCSPNNPDGSLIPSEDLLRLLQLPVLVVVDEAYVEFAGESRIGWVKKYPNLGIIRTFSKWAGLAGLRVGYGAFPEAVVRRMLRIKQPYNVNVAAGQAAIASLEDSEWLLANVRRITAERERLSAALRSIDWLTVFPSRSNFILCRVRGREAVAVKQNLAQAGILIRYFNKPGLQDCIRVSVGRPSDTDAIIAALKAMKT
jgi:histidinol dehydrogenase